MTSEPARDELAQLLGQVLDGKYRLDGVLGRGGMGVVYQATHLGTRRVVALKVIAPGFLAEAEFVERFRREAEAAGRLRHPNVVDVTDFGFGDVAGRRLAYLVMEYLDGCSLEEVLRQEGRLPLRWAADIIDQVSSAVAEAHRRGIVHRDLKPGNLWLEPDRRGGYTVKVLDFGLAKLAEAATAPPTAPSSRETAPRDVESPTRSAAAASPVNAAPAPPLTEQETRARVPPSPASSSGSRDLTRLGATLGTPLYMSPEQCRGEPAGERSDVYSLGVIAYRLISGRTPFSGGEAELIRQHLTAKPAPLDGVRKKTPKAVAALVMSALAKDPAQRPAGAAAFGTAFVARAEGAATVLRQVLTLLVEHARSFLGIAALGVAPAMAIALLGVLAAGALTGVPRAAALSALWLWGVVLFVAGMMAANAVTVPVVAQLLATPLRPVELRPLLRALRQRLADYGRLLGWLALGYLKWTLLPSACVGVFWLSIVLPYVPPPQRGWLVPLLLAPMVLPAVWMIANLDSLGFASAAILMEGLAGAPARERSRSLARLAKRDLPGFEGVRGSIAVGAAVALVLLSQVARFSFEGGSARTPLVIVALFLAVLALGVVGAALVHVSVALLYFKARQAAGEPLAEGLDQFERQALPAGYWQRQIRDRIRLQVESIR